MAEFTCPGGRTAIVRDIDVYSEGIDAGTLFVEGSEGQTITKINKSALNDVVSQWSGRQVLDEGETLTLRVSGHALWDVSVSGYLLTA